MLEPGDAVSASALCHDRIAEGGVHDVFHRFRASPAELAQELLVRLAEDAGEDDHPLLYRDAGRDAVAQPAHIPAGLRDFRARALDRVRWPTLVLERAGQIPHRAQAQRVV